MGGWLNASGLGRFAVEFKDKGVDGQRLLEASRVRLESLGVDGDDLDTLLIKLQELRRMKTVMFFFFFSLIFFFAVSGATRAAEVSGPNAGLAGFPRDLYESISCDVTLLSMRSIIACTCEGIRFSHQKSSNRKYVFCLQWFLLFHND